MSEKTDSDGFTPLGRKLQRICEHDGFNGVAEFLNKLLDAMGSTSWHSRNVSDLVRDQLNKPLNTTVFDDIDALMRSLHDWEE